LVILRRDGILYFTVIFGANLLNVLLYSLAAQSIKAIGASFSQLVTTVMISHLQLNLRDPRFRSANGPWDGATRTVSEHRQGASEAGADISTVSGQKDSQVSTNFFIDTLRDLGMPLSASEGTTYWDEEVQLDEIRAQREPAVDENVLFPPPRSSLSIHEQEDGIVVSPALIDGPSGPMLYEEWRRRPGPSGSIA